jgi:uncharacterized cupin superfamily protein
MSPRGRSTATSRCSRRRVEHLTHFDDTASERQDVEGSDIDALWQDLGRAAGSVEVGLNRIRFEPGRRPTPAHDHGAEEEIFYVLSGSGLSWRAGETHEVRAGDCLVYRPDEGAHTLIAGDEPLDVLAFGERRPAELAHLPRAGVLWAGPSWVDDAVAAGHPFQREADAGWLPMPSAVSPRPTWIVHRDDVPATAEERPGRSYVSRRLGVAAGGLTTGLRHVVIAAGSHGVPRHCHGDEEELFVILGGAGTVRIGDQHAPVHAGHVVSRPAGTALAHAFRAGPAGLEYLAYGQRKPNDIVYYPDSRKFFLCGVGVIGRVELLDYWDGEDARN